MTFPKTSLECYVLRVGKGCVLSQQEWMLAAVHYWKGFPGSDTWLALCGVSGPSYHVKALSVRGMISVVALEHAKEKADGMRPQTEET